MHSIIHRIAIPFAIVQMAASIATQTDNWTLEAPVNAPSGRSAAAMAFDAARGRSVLFGGYSPSGSTVFGDTWEWDGATWLARFSLHYPPSRWESAMAYDSVRQRIVLFGGFSNTSVGMNDTWEWDGVDWVQANPVNRPSVRWAHRMAYDAARQRVVLFGGYASTSSVSSQTWEWNGVNWVLRNPATQFAGRAEHAMAYDPVRQRIVMFGGYNNSNLLADTWEWDGTNWAQRATTGILLSGRRRHAMAYDAWRQRIVLFGGDAGTNPFADTVEWNGLVWAQSLPTTSPSARQGHAMVFDVGRQRLVMFSGAGLPNDTWTRGPLNTPAAATTFGNGCGTPPLGFVPSPAARPILGQSGGATITNTTSSVGAVAMGWSRTTYGPFSLPVTLAAIGMPGCDLLQSSDVLGLAAPPLTPTSLAFALAVPSSVGLIGARVYLQAYAFAPGANTLEVLASNGIEWFLGDV